MENKERIEKIRQVLKLYDQKEFGSDEFFEELDNEGVILKPKVIEKIVERQLKTSPEQLAYIKAWKERKKEREKEEDEKKKRELKLKEALETRKIYYCFECRKKYEATDVSHELKTKRNGKKHIILLTKCPFCAKETKTYGGIY